MIDKSEQAKIATELMGVMKKYDLDDSNILYMLTMILGIQITRTIYYSGVRNKKDLEMLSYDLLDISIDTLKKGIKDVSNEIGE